MYCIMESKGAAATADSVSAIKARNLLIKDFLAETTEEDSRVYFCHVAILEKHAVVVTYGYVCHHVQAGLC